MQPAEADVLYYFICTVLTVRSAAAQTDLLEDLSPRFEPWRHDRYWLMVVRVQYTSIILNV